MPVVPAPGVEQVQVSENVITVLDLNKYNTLNALNLIYKDIEKHIDISTTTYFSYPEDYETIQNDFR